MSKTDKTRPWWVRATEQPGYTCVPVHNHDTAACTLPADPAAGEGEGLVFQQARCYWVEGKGFWYGRDNKGCGCPRCTSQAARRRERRADRHSAALMCRDAVRVAATGPDAVEDFDPYVVPNSMW